LDLTEDEENAAEDDEEDDGNEDDVVEGIWEDEVGMQLWKVAHLHHLKRRRCRGRNSVWTLMVILCFYFSYLSLDFWKPFIRLKNITNIKNYCIKIRLK
jgi:hypothetical protein